MGREQETRYGTEKPATILCRNNVHWAIASTASGKNISHNFSKCSFTPQDHDLVTSSTEEAEFFHNFSCVIPHLMSPHIFLHHLFIPYNMVCQKWYSYISTQSKVFQDLILINLLACKELLHFFFWRTVLLNWLRY